MPVAAIESLILLLSHSPPSTISETLSLLSGYSKTLKSSVANPIAVSAGTDLFQRYLISVLQSPPSTNKSEGKPPITVQGSSTDDFQAIRNHLINNRQSFIAQAKEARSQIANIAQHFIRYNNTILTYGSSRAVGATLAAAFRAGTSFKLVYVCDSGTASPSPADIPSTMPPPSPELPVALIRPSEVAHVLPQTSMVLLGAEGVVENGGIISRMGTYQLGVLAKSAGKPVYVCAESHKFVRMFPLSQNDVCGEVLRFSEGVEKGGGIEEKGKGGGKSRVDYTPPELITALVSESGVHTPSAVSEELIQMWY